MTTTEIAQHHREQAATGRMRAQALQNAEIAADWEAKAQWHEEAAGMLEGLETKEDEDLGSVLGEEDGAPE
jgi:hypothetical protein